MSLLDHVAKLASILPARIFLSDRNDPAIDRRSSVNSLARSLCGRLAVLAAACCSDTSNSVGVDELIGQVWRFLAITELTSMDEELDRRSSELFVKASAKPDLRKLIGSKEAATEIMTRFTLARISRRQWAPQNQRLDEIYRTYWITRQIDATGELHTTLARMLGMEAALFIKTALALLALAYENKGHIDLNDATLSLRLNSLDVAIDDMLFVAHRLSRDSEEFAEWHQRDVVRHATPGFHQHVPDPLQITPLIKVSTGFLCPSIDAFVASLDVTYRNALSSLESEVRSRVFTEYGDILERYAIAFASKAMGVDRVHDMNAFESKNNEHADLLLVEGEYGVLVEIKRTLATSLEKSVLNVDAIIEIFTKLNKAYSQCKSSARRKAWRSNPRLHNVQHVESLILLDDMTILEGGVLAMALYALGPVDPRFEAVSFVTFEDIVATSGAKSIVQTMRQKWLTGHCDMPIRQYARLVQRRGISTAPDARQLLRPASEELLGSLRVGNFDASWP